MKLYKCKDFDQIALRNDFYEIYKQKDTYLYVLLLKDWKLRAQEQLLHLSDDELANYLTYLEMQERISSFDINHTVSYLMTFVGIELTIFITFEGGKEHLLPVIFIIALYLFFFLLFLFMMNEYKRRSLFYANLKDVLIDMKIK